MAPRSPMRNWKPLQVGSSITTRAMRQRIVARLETHSGIPRDEWIWGRTARYCIRAYADIRRYARESGMGGAERVRDELDEAVNALARLKKSIKRRIEAKREAENG